MRRRCTGVTASWCPVCGDCRCPELPNDAGRTFSDPGCPLHAPDSPHGFEERLEAAMASTQPAGAPAGWVLADRVVRRSAVGVTVIECYRSATGGVLLIPAGGASVDDLLGDVVARLEAAGLGYTVEPDVGAG